MLVSRAVCQWMEPHLYTVLILTAHQAPLILSAIHTKPRSVFSSGVRKLFLADDLASSISTADIQTILSVCTGTTDLFIAPKGHIFLPLVSMMPLQRLSADLRSLFSGRPIDFQHTLLRNITHLCVFPLMREDATQWADVRHIPRLTHLAFHTFRAAETLQDVLHCCPNLHVLVNFYFSRSTVGAQRAVDSGLAEDLRYVRVQRGFYVKDWKGGAYTGQDYWTRAEELIAQRTLGQVDCLTYVVPDV
ncbi:hypothetical protein B0H19DRAFT_1374523 [Mycena capillaripes]|nr:hypothetical protein B0H19DRAFT_1374523 [Mycena capillaripes]